MAEQFNRPVRPWFPGASQSSGLVYLDTTKPLPFTLPLTHTRTVDDVITTTDAHPFGLMPELKIKESEKPFNIETIPMTVMSTPTQSIHSNDVLIRRLTKEGVTTELILNWQMKIKNRKADLPFLTDYAAENVYAMFHRFGQVRINHTGISLELGTYQKKVFTISLSADGSRIETNRGLLGSGKLDEKYSLMYVHRNSGHHKNTFSIVAGMLPGDDDMVLTYNLEYDKRLMHDPGFLIDVIGMPYDRPEFIRPYIQPFIHIQRLKTQ